MLHKKLFVGAVFLGGAALFAAAQLSQAAATAQPADPVLVPTPRATVLATTASSRPFLAAANAQQPVNLAVRGYAETEWLVRGYANVYEWAASGKEVVVRNANQPYVTRILVRRPLDAKNFSGWVIVEVLDWAAQYETAPLWGYSAEHFLRRGDAWVGVTIAPAAAATLRKFNATRYGTLNLTANQPEPCDKRQEGGAGFAWDVIAQVGALLRSSSKENPLLGLEPQRVLAAGHAQGGEAITTFAIALHRGLRLGDDAPIFDGYLDVPGLSGAALDRCAVQLSSHEARPSSLPDALPMVRVLTEMDLVLPTMRTSGDVQGEGVRVHEVAGAEGAGPMPAGLPAVGDLAATGLTIPQGRCREPLMDQALSYALNAVWQQFDDLLMLKQPMLRLPHIETTLDGGAFGGWRQPQLDLPVAGRVPGRRLVSTPPGAPRVCDAATGSMPRFDAATLKQLYRSRAEYLRRFSALVDQAVLVRLLVKEDADALKAAVARGLPAF